MHRKGYPDPRTAEILNLGAGKTKTKKNKKRKKKARKTVDVHSMSTCDTSSVDSITEIYAL